MSSIWKKKMSRRDFLKTATVTGGVGAASYLGLFGQTAYGASTDLHTQATMKALVDAVVPQTPDLVKSMGAEYLPGGLDEYMDEFMIYSFDHYFSANNASLPIATSIQQSIQAVTNLLSGVSTKTGTANAPLASATAVLLDVYAGELITSGKAHDTPNPLTFPGGGTFASLSRDDRFRALYLMETTTVALHGVPSPYKNNAGLINFIAGALVEFATFGYYNEWSGYGTTRTNAPEDRVFEKPPLSWGQTDFPGPSNGSTDYRGFAFDKFGKKE